VTDDKPITVIAPRQLSELAVLLDSLSAEQRAAVIDLATTTMFTHAQALDALLDADWNMNLARAMALQFALQRRAIL
jgi:hypothetical protein